DPATHLAIAKDIAATLRENENISIPRVEAFIQELEDNVSHDNVSFDNGAADSSIPESDPEETAVFIHAAGWNTFDRIDSDREEVLLASAYLRSIDNENMAVHLEDIANRGLIRAGPVEGFVVSPYEEGLAINTSDPAFSSALARTALLVYGVGMFFEYGHQDNLSRAEGLYSWYDEFPSQVRSLPENGLRKRNYIHLYDLYMKRGGHEAVSAAVGELSDKLGFNDQVTALFGRLHSPDIHKTRTPDQIRSLRREILGDKPVAVVFGGGGGILKVTVPALRALGYQVVTVQPATDNGGRTGKQAMMIYPVKGSMFSVGDVVNAMTEALPADRYRKRREWLNANPQRNGSETYIQAISRMLRDSEWDDLFREEYIVSYLIDMTNIAYIIQSDFVDNPDYRGNDEYPDFSYSKMAIRNMAILAVFHHFRAMERFNETDQEMARVASWILESIFGIPSESRFYTLPVSYEEAILRVVYGEPIPDSEREHMESTANGIGRKFSMYLDESHSHHPCVYGQAFLDKLADNKVLDMQAVRSPHEPSVIPAAQNDVIDLLNDPQVKLIVVGAGSLYSSILSQLSFKGIMETIIKREDAQRVWVANHVNMDETNDYEFRDHVLAFERVASRQGVMPDDFVVDLARRRGRGDVVREDGFWKVAVPDGRGELEFAVHLGDIFDYIVLNDSKAKLLHQYVQERGLDKFSEPMDHALLAKACPHGGITPEYYRRRYGRYGSPLVTDTAEMSPQYINIETGELLPVVLSDDHVVYDKNVEVELDGQGRIMTYVPVVYGQDGPRRAHSNEVLLNRYTYILHRHPELIEEFAITADDWRMLAAFDHENRFEADRSEAGKWRGAICPTESEVEYLLRHGISREGILLAPIVNWTTKQLKGSAETRYEVLAGIVGDRVAEVMKRHILPGAANDNVSYDNGEAEVNYAAQIQRDRLQSGLADAGKYHDVLMLLVKEDSLEQTAMAIEQAKGVVVPENIRIVKVYEDTPSSVIAEAVTGRRSD
ncbi:MAG: 2-phospho-L-lactate transferase CofD family protein, partial [Candidatus Omnitrophica bacterium]|nr:2-phospho-L-lactate transferase CofD family protein [Candidatus Omnitrophota bacterium]